MSQQKRRGSRGRREKGTRCFAFLALLYTPPPALTAYSCLHRAVSRLSPPQLTADRSPSEGPRALFFFICSLACGFPGLVFKLRRSPFVVTGALFTGTRFLRNDAPARDSKFSAASVDPRVVLSGQRASRIYNLTSKLGRETMVWM